MKKIAFLLCLVWAMAAAACGAPVPPTSTSRPTQRVGAVPTEDLYAPLRQWMVDRQIVARGLQNERVLEAMRQTPRHLFVPADYIAQAYEDHPLPIGFGQTISQPYIVALMTEMLDPQPDDVVLEVGTGSGYQAAVLAYLVRHVYTVEIIPELAESAAKRLQELGYTNVTVANLDGYYGWAEHAPFDKIIVTCAPDHIPPDLVAQLREGGRMAIPVGPPGLGQTLWLVEKKPGGEIATTNYGLVSFVPLIGGHEKQAP
ncbi:MAG: protein-L-isoaspartate(D-aspartate) O-methyltransferase [Chloroflexia bacterium]